MKRRIAAVVPAAGLGQRAGMPKWRIKYSGKLFIEIIRDLLVDVGVNKIFCVYRNGDKPHVGGICYLENKTPEFGMFSSIYWASVQASAYQSIFVWPVDHPFVRKETLNAMILKTKSYPQSIIKPSNNRVNGHPVILPGKILAKIVDLEPNYYGGLKNFLIECKIESIRVNVKDDGILRNVTTMKDLQE